jgi:protein gp37
MADGTKIEWTDATWNIINGCSVVSPGCTNCYAMRLAGTRLKHHPSRAGLTGETKAGPVWTGETRFNEPVLLDPIRWRRPRKIFVCAHGDLFHESVPDEWLDRVFAVMALASQHVFQVLTKRPERMRDYAHALVTGNRSIWAAARDLGLNAAGIAETMTMLDWGGYEWRGANPLPNVWLGTSVEDQKRADERIPILLDTPAAVRWLSCEPLLGPIDLGVHMVAVHHHPDNRDRESSAMQSLIKAARDSIGGGIDWIVAGGESGPGARPMHADWVRPLRDQCAAAGVPFMFKQWGDWFPYGEIDGDGHQNSRDRGERSGLWHVWPAPLGGFACLIGKRQAGRALDGVQHDGYPAP